jgi:hypothetical protein
MTNKTAKPEADPAALVSLRLWSDNIAFGDAGRLIALAPEIIANKGEPKPMARAPYGGTPHPAAP